MVEIFRYQIPVDGQWHAVGLSGPVVHVAARCKGVVEFWAIHGKETPRIREFTVVGTGHPFSHVDTVYRGSAIDPDGTRVWHLLEEE